MATSKAGDKIYIRDLLLRCIIGIFDEERKNKQDVLVNLVLEADLGRAGRSDNIKDTVDYKDLTKRIIAAAESSSYFLVERLAEAIASICLSAPGVQSARVTVEKPGALRYARSVGVEIERTRKNAHREKKTAQRGR